MSGDAELHRQWRRRREGKEFVVTKAATEPPSEIVRGRIYFASTRATQLRYYREGEVVSIRDYFHVHPIGEGFVQVDLDRTGRNYVHVQVAK